MRSVLTLVCLLLVLSASVAGAESWTTQLLVKGNPDYIDVVTTATDKVTCWNWEYALTPKNGATGINGLTITLGVSEAALVSNITGPLNWLSGVVDDKVAWRTLSFSPFIYNPLNAGSTFTFGFDHPWGPKADVVASAQDTYGYSGPVSGPVVPEPMGIMVVIMGLGSVAGFRRLRGK